MYNLSIPVTYLIKFDMFPHPCSTTYDHFLNNAYTTHENVLSWRGEQPKLVAPLSPITKLKSDKIMAMKV